MRLHLRILSLFLFCIVIFVLVFTLFISYERQGLLRLIDSEKTDEARNFDRFVDLAGESLKTLAYDYTWWDEMVNFIQTEDLQWAQNNLDPAVETFRASGIWVCRLDGSLIYATPGAREMGITPLPENIPLLKAKRHMHYFRRTPRGLLEVQAATIHSSGDAARKGEPYGLFYAAKLWDQAYINWLANLCDAKVDLVLGADTAAGMNDLKVPNGAMTYQKILSDAAGNPIARLRVVKLSSAFIEFSTTSRNLAVVFSCCFFLSIVLLFVFSVIWITRPLGKISRSLREGKALDAAQLKHATPEFLEISRLIRRFFEQSEALSKEVSSHKAMEEELRRAYNSLQETQSQLIQSEKLQMIGTLASGMTHEIKNPLAIIQQGVDYLSRRILAEDGNIATTLHHIREAIGRADRIIRDMLEFTAAKPLNMVRQDIKPVVEQALSFFDHHLRKNHVQVIRDFAGDLPEINMDSNRMVQVFTGILMNSLEAMPNSGFLTIKMFKNSAGGVTVEVLDTGPGLADGVAERAFDPFFTTHRESGAAGLGLAVAHNIIEQHSGKITIENRQDVRGAKVTVSLNA